MNPCHPAPDSGELFTAVHSPGRRWPGALRAALALAIPGSVALLLGYEAEMLLIAAGGFAVIYGEGHPWRTRWRVMGTAGLLLVGGSVAGALVGSVVWAQDSHWWLLLAALFTAGAAGLGALVHNALRLPPPGSFFIIMVTGGATMVARLSLNPLEVGAWASVGALSGLSLGMLPRPAPERGAVDTLEKAVADFAAALGAGALGIALGFDRPDWAIVPALLILQWGPDRLPGTIRGIGLFALLHVADLTLWGLLLALAVCQFFAEVFVVRNYVLCVIFTTPLALMMGNALALPLGETMTSRTIEVLLSVVFALALLWVAPRDAAHHARLMRRSRETMLALLGTLLAATPNEALALQNTGYALPDRCNARPDTRLPLGDIQAVAERIS